ncbi:helix-turn-helix domain-containing protein [Sutcliffiella horikoshii]|nr:helix-turn-helix domain-containing protein [Sutcliffiella horikoshii]
MKNTGGENDYPLILTAKEICEILKISKPTAYEIMSRSNFPLLKIGKCKRVFRNDFFDWLKSERKNHHSNNKKL